MLSKTNTTENNLKHDFVADSKLKEVFNFLSRFYLTPHLAPFCYRTTDRPSGRHFEYAFEHLGAPTVTYLISSTELKHFVHNLIRKLG